MRLLRVLAALLGSILPLLAGDLAGQIVITKQLTRKTVVAPIYSLRGGAPAPSAVPKDVVNEFSSTVVILEGPNGRPPDPVTAVIEQRNSRFEPDLLVIPVGSTVEFPNFDPIFHNIFSLSGAQQFDLGFYSKNKSRSVKFNRKGVVQLYCHIHSNMYAAIVVTSSPWFGKPAADGTFSWSGLPAGHYHVLAWHKIAGQYSVEVEIPETGIAHVTLRVPIDVEQRP